MKLIVAGGREFNDYALLKDRLDFYLQNTDKSDIVIIDGCATGADRLGRKYSEEVLGKDTEKYPADWDDITVAGAVIRYRKGKPYNAAAGNIRNKQMASVATHLIAFWNGTIKNSGTYDMIQIATRLGLTVRVIRY